MNNIIKRKWNQNSMVIIEDLQGMAFQAESGGHTFQISGIDGEGNAVALSGTPAGVMLRADGQDVTLTCSASEGVISATLPANAYSVPGRFGLTIFLTSDGQKTAIYAAVGTVGKTSSGTVAPPSGSDVVDLVNRISEAIAAIPASYNSCFAPAYSTSGLYSVGQYVTYDGKLYRCNTAITTAETWTAAHWTQTNLGADVYDLKSALSADEFSIEPFQKSDWEQGTIKNSGVKSDSIYRIRLKNNCIAIKDFKVSNVKGYTLNIFKYLPDSTVTSTGYPADDTITEYSISKNDVFNIVLSKYPISETTTDDYNKIRYIGLTKYDNLVNDVGIINGEIQNIDNALEAKLFTASDFEVGSIRDSGDHIGEKTDNAYRIRLKYNYCAPFNFSVTNKTGYNFTVFRYTEDGQYDDYNSGYLLNDDPHTVNVTAGQYVNIVVYKIPLVEVTTAIYNGISISGATEIDVIEEKLSKINDNNRINNVISDATFFESADITYLTNKYYVGEGKDYATINGALTAWASDNYPPAVVFIGNGEYNETIFVEDKTIAFIGESKDGTVVRTKTGAYSYPPFKIHHGNVLIANLTAIADHSANPDFAYTSGSTMAYAFHIDGGSVGGNVVIRNCKAVSYQSPAFGMGLIPNSRIRLENIEAFTYTDDTTNSSTSLNYGCILCHMPMISTYPSQAANDSDLIELVDVKAYAKNSQRVISLTQGDSISAMKVCAVNTVTASGKTTLQEDMLRIPNTAIIDNLSSGNTIPFLNAD